MYLTLERKEFTDNSTIGDLYINGDWFCYTLEDKVRPQKIKHETAIPEGTYQVEITYSPKFKQLMPILLNVPNFIGIRIHPGNDKSDTSGCILVGENKTVDRITNSRKAYKRLFKILNSASKRGETIMIQIKSCHD